MLASIGLALLGGLRKIAAFVLDLLKNYPWQCALGIALFAAWWQWDGKHDALEQRDKLALALRAANEARKADRKEWERKVALAQAETAKALAQGKEVARNAQETVERLAKDRDGLRAFIAANRLRGQGGRAADPTRSGGGDDPAVPAEGATETLVAVRESDLRICDDLYIYAFGAYEFATELRVLGRAVPPVGFAQ